MSNILSRILTKLRGKPSGASSSPTQYRVYKEARKYLGLKEIPGPEHSMEVIAMFKAVGHPRVQDDETAWCAAFAGAMYESLGIESTRKLNARSYLDFGESVKLENLKKGDVVVFWRVGPDDWRGHVGFFVRFSDTGDLVVLGGNQNNSVSEKVYSKDRFLSGQRYTGQVINTCN